MEELVFDIFSRNNIYFCEDYNDRSTSSIQAMMDCFEVFIIDDNCFFYRLKEDCVNRGYLDENECLISPCEGYGQMICMGKLSKNFESSIWIEESEFYSSKENGTLKNLIKEMIEAYKIDHSSDDSSLEKSELSEPSEEPSEESTYEVSDDGPDSNDNNINDKTTKQNFQHGYSSE